MPKKKIPGKVFNPWKYNMNFCNECHGLGKTFNEDDSKKVCQICGGFGLIKKQGCGFEEEEGT